MVKIINFILYTSPQFKKNPSTVSYLSQDQVETLKQVIHGPRSLTSTHLSSFLASSGLRLHAISLNTTHRCRSQRPANITADS